MSDSNADVTADRSMQSLDDCQAGLDAWRRDGAHRFDPVGFHYLEVLVQRASAHHGAATPILLRTLSQSFNAFGERFEQAQREAQVAAAHATEQFPASAPELTRLLTAGDYKALKRRIARLSGMDAQDALSALVKHCEQLAAQKAAARPHTGFSHRPESQSIRDFRQTLAELSVDKQLTQALDQAPKNAGPINSHMLMLQALELMRDLAPDYLHAFMSYADALLCLEQGPRHALAPAKNTRQSKTSNRT